MVIILPRMSCRVFVVITSPLVDAVVLEQVLKHPLSLLSEMVDVVVLKHLLLGTMVLCVAAPHDLSLPQLLFGVLVDVVVLEPCVALLLLGVSVNTKKIMKSSEFEVGEGIGFPHIIKFLIEISNI
jgi:hypothetical protein